jgi:hypothetical protein
MTIKIDVNIDTQKKAWYILLTIVLTFIIVKPIVLLCRGAVEVVLYILAAILWCYDAGEWVFTSKLHPLLSKGSI